MRGRSDVVAEALTWLGTPYEHQASLKHVGCDCLGLLRGVWRELYDVEPEIMPPYAPRWSDANDASTDLLLDMATRYFIKKPNQQPPMAGDILLFKYRMNADCKHVGIATSSTRFIHAYVGRGVVENSLSPWWLRHRAAQFMWRN